MPIYTMLPLYDRTETGHLLGLFEKQMGVGSMRVGLGVGDYGAGDGSDGSDESDRLGRQGPMRSMRR